KYAASMTAAAGSASATAAGAPRATLDSTMVGAWVGTVHAASGDVRLQLAIAPNGEVQARIGERTDSGVARAAGPDASRLVVRFPGDLEAPNPAGMNRETRMYLDRRGARYGGVITTRPPSASGLDGSVSYWLEMARQP